MAERKIQSLWINCEEIDDKCGYRVEITKEPKKSISQKAGWVPSGYEQPEKFTATSKEKLLAKLKEIL